ncbi:MAG: hypothetical protein V1754_03390, partial [Pseudomonadota bacterium]
MQTPNQQTDLATNQAVILAGPARNKETLSRFLGLRSVERIVLDLLKNGVNQITVAGSENTLPEQLRSKVRFVDLDEITVIRNCLEKNQNDMFVLAGDLLCHPKLIPFLSETARKTKVSQVVVEDLFHPALLLRAQDLSKLPETTDLKEMVTLLTERGISQRLEAPDVTFATPLISDENRKRATRS